MKLLGLSLLSLAIWNFALPFTAWTSGWLWASLASPAMKAPATPSRWGDPALVSWGPNQSSFPAGHSECQCAASNSMKLGTTEVLLQGAFPSPHICQRWAVVEKGGNVGLDQPQKTRLSLSRLDHWWDSENWEFACLTAVPSPGFWRARGCLILFILLPVVISQPCPWALGPLLWAPVDKWLLLLTCHSPSLTCLPSFLVTYTNRTFD